jgi:two-component system, NtrC family, sensor kinase
MASGRQPRLGWCHRAALKDLPQLEKSRVGWFRCAFILDSAVLSLPLALRVWHSGAAEVFLDGKLFRRYGDIGPNAQIQKANSPLSADFHRLPNLRPGRHVVAVRLVHFIPYWLEPGRYGRSSSVLNVGIINMDGQARREVERTFQSTVESYLIAGFVLAISAIHGLYFWNRRKRVNAVFSLTMLMFAVFYLMGDVARFTTSPRLTEWAVFIQQVAQSLFYCLLLMTYYLYWHKRLPVVYYAVVGTLIGSTLINGYADILWMIFIAKCCLVLILLLGVYVSVRAVRQKSANASIILINLALLITIVLIEAVARAFVDQVVLSRFDWLGHLFVALFYLSIPLTMAVLLARENAQTNEELALQLQEVEKLSAEKETILLQQNATLEQQVAERTAELSQSLENLRTTQQQLVQSEKMASLGELTAGIAHEIQNPLNFVNNFSEVSAELVQEIKEERIKTDRDEQLEAELLGDLGQNLEKITHHGKRAASIVRGMLEHSRTNAGQRELTDLNALADEYLRLSYHGLRAKTKSFNAKLVTEYDPTLNPLLVLNQDIGRVLLNLFTNAFYAVDERAKTKLTGYEPTVSVRTHALPEGAEIRVSDNGTGIPAAIREKIFQPFFTTKPTGQGTGLGLSLSYDIITKGHGGSLSVESEEGQGTTFVIHLPNRS